MTTFAAALAEGRSALQRAGIENAALDARLLLAAASGLDSAALIARSGEMLPKLAQSTFDHHLMRRLDREPVARILGEAEFWSLGFTLSAATLVPRPETETLVEVVLQTVRRGGRRDISICDLGTGSGAIAIALLHELPEAHCVATDISAAALATAEANAERHGVGSRLRLEKVDFADGPCGSFDVVVSNPPYVQSELIAALAPEVRDHDPKIALDGGADGLYFYRIILARLAGLLADGGFVALEVGFDQSDAVAGFCREQGLSDVRSVRDLGGVARVVAAGGSTLNGNPDDAKKALGKVG